MDDLCQKLKRNIKIENDANCFAVSEAMDGAGSQYSNVFGVILGTGVGSGIVLNKKLVKGSNGISGEWGHNTLPWKGKLESNQRLCWCGKFDCIEKYISGPSVENEHKEVFNEELSMQQIAKKYEAVCTPDFFGYNENLELQYRGRIRELKELKPVRSGESDLYIAMKLISETGNGPKDQIPSMGCNIKWLNN